MSGSGGSAAARSARAWGQPPPQASPQAGQQLLSIGEVLAELRGDFPETSISKLRFLEGEGLVEPQRTPAGYRKYTVADVARLRYVLAAQRDHYLPLRVIRDQLAAMDRGEAPALVAVPAAAPASHDEAEAAPAADERLTQAELVARAGVSEEILFDLEKHGIVVPEEGGRYPADAVEVLRVAGVLAEFGVTARHLRSYRVAADREVGLFTQLVKPQARGNGDRAAEMVRELAGLTGRLHGALVRIGLGQTLR